jgi:hypothetical protein
MNTRPWTFGTLLKTALFEFVEVFGTVLAKRGTLIWQV